MAVVETSTGQVRVSYAERERVAQRLAEAHGEGRLTLAEFDERARSAHGAVVRADLEPLLTDLPAGSDHAGAARPGRPRTGSTGTGRPEAEWSTGVGARRHHPHPGPGMPPLPFAGPCGALGLRGAATAWAVASVVNLLIWVAVVAGTGHLVHPWWIWVAGPWGLVLLVRVGAGRRFASPGPLPGR